MDPHGRSLDPDHSFEKLHIFPHTFFYFCDVVYFGYDTERKFWFEINFQAELLAVDEDQLALLVQLGYSVSEARSASY